MTNQEIKTVGQTIAQETQIGGNTAARVGGVVEGIGVALDNKDAANGYYQATISGGTITVNAPNYLLGSGGNLRIKMPSVGTTASTLTIGNANAVQLWYNGAAVSAQNTWDANEIISVFYDGTRFMASNSQGGGGKAEKISYDNSQSGLASDNVQGALDLVSDGVRKTLITIPSTIHTNGFMKFDGTFVSATGFDSRFTELIPCQEGDKFVWTGAGNGAYSVPTQVTSGNSAITWIFYDSSRSRVSSWSVGLSTQVVTIPSGVAYVQFTGIVKTTSATRPFIVGYNDVRLNVNDITKRMIQPILHVGGFLKYDDTWATGANFDTSYTGLIPCKEGDKFIYYGVAVSNTYPKPIQVTSGNAAISWIFYDSNKTRVSSWQLGYQNPYIVEIPSGVSYVKFAGIVRSTNATRPFSVWHDDYIIKSTEIRNENVIPSTIHTNGFMKFDGTFVSATGFDSRFTELIPCQEGDKFVWTGAGNGAYSVPTQVTSGNSAITWIFYDSSRSRVSSWSVGLSTQVVTIPSGVAYVQFTGIVKTTSATRPFSVWKDGFIISIAEGGSLLEKWKGLKWVAFGDSLTEHNIRATKNYHDYINEWTGISVVNRGVGGSGYKYLYDESKAFYQRIQTQTDEDADVVTIFGSGNDLHLNNGVPIYPLGDVDDTGTETVCGCINATLDWLQANRPLMPLGIISMTPWRTNGGVPSANQDAYVDKLEQICRKRGIPYLDLYHCSNLHPNSSEFKNIAYKRDGTYSASSQGVTGAIQVTADNLSIVRAFGVSNAQIGDWVLPNLTGVHPDEDGQKFFAPRIKAFLEELIEK